MQNWSAAASHLDLSDVIRRHEEVEAELERKRAAGECAAATAGQCGGAAGAGDGDADAVAAAMSMGERRREGRAKRAPRRPAVPIVDVTRQPLPNAPSFSLYCLYGMGTPTERGYHFLRTKRQNFTEWSINKVASDPPTGLESGSQLSDGDGTVPLLSLGALCEGGWRSPKLNPGGSRVVVREYPHDPVYSITDPRGGPGASTHVEILGHDGVLADVLRIVSGAADDGGNEEAVTDRHHSTIKEIVARIEW